MLVCRFVLKPSRQSIRAFSLSRVRPLIRAAAEYAAFPPAAMATMVELERQGWCLAAGIAYPQPWMNLEEIGAAVAISVDTAVPGAVAKAEAAVSELAAGLFASREDFMPVEGSVVPYAEAVARAFSWHCTADGVAVLRTKGVDALVVIGDGVDSTNTGPLSDPLQTTQTWSTGSSCRACGGGRGAWGHDLDSVRAAEVRLAAGWCNDGVGLCRHGGNSRGRGRGRGPSTRAWGAAGESERERERERREAPSAAGMGLSCCEFDCSTTEPDSVLAGCLTQARSLDSAPGELRRREALRRELHHHHRPRNTMLQRLSIVPPTFPKLPWQSQCAGLFSDLGRGAALRIISRG